MWCLCDLTSSDWCKTDAISMDFGSISTWEDLTTRFLAQLFPSRRTAKLQNDILMFQQHEGRNLANGEKWRPMWADKQYNALTTTRAITSGRTQSSPQVLPSFEVYTPLVTYSKEVEETIRISMEVEPIHHTKLEDLGLNTCSHDIFLSYREIPSVDESKPQLLPNFSPLDVYIGDKRGTDPPIKPHSPDSFRMKVVDKSTISTPPSPHVASFHPKDTYCYYHPCIDDPKKHYGFKQSLLGQSGSLGVDF
nr:zinc finger, CCHC-type [Tanacetum cinerariifolium]